MPGGGWALLRLINALEEEAKKDQGDMRTGVLILRHALDTPTRQIAANSGYDGGVVVDRIRNGQGSFGFDASVGNMLISWKRGSWMPRR